MPYIRLIDPAIEDLEHLLRLDPSILRKVIAKMLILELDTEAGEPLLGDLIGWRKLRVGNRSWRIIWRSTEDKSGDIIIEIAQIWAIGARSDSAIYNEMKQRISSLPDSPNTTSLTHVIELLGSKSGEIDATPEPTYELAPRWLLDRLEHSAGMPTDQIQGLSVDEAMSLWEAYITRPSS